MAEALEKYIRAHHVDGRDFQGFEMTDDNECGEKEEEEQERRLFEDDRFHRFGFIPLDSYSTSLSSPEEGTWAFGKFSSEGDEEIDVLLKQFRKGLDLPALQRSKNSSFENMHHTGEEMAIFGPWTVKQDFEGLIFEQRFTGRTQREIPTQDLNKMQIAACEAMQDFLIQRPGPSKEVKRAMERITQHVHRLKEFTRAKQSFDYNLEETKRTQEEEGEESVDIVGINEAESVSFLSQDSAAILHAGLPESFWSEN